MNPDNVIAILTALIQEIADRQTRSYDEEAMRQAATKAALEDARNLIVTFGLPTLTSDERTIYYRQGYVDTVKAYKARTGCSLYQAQAVVKLYIAGKI